MGFGHYILVNGRPVPEPDLIKWSNWFVPNTEARIVKQEYVGDLFVSTVFLGLDHNYSPTGPPILWETMVFNKEPNRDCREMTRCAGNREQAEAMHDEMVRTIRAQQHTQNEQL